MPVIIIWAKILEIMRKLVLIVALAFTGVLFSSNANDESLINPDDVFVPCYAIVTFSEYNPVTGGYITTSETYYLGEVDYGSHGFNAAACEGRVNRLMQAMHP